MALAPVCTRAGGALRGAGRRAGGAAPGVSLRAGIIAMVLALVCTGAVALFAVLGGPPEPVAAAKAATEGGAEPLVRSDPGVEPWKEEVVAFVGADPQAPEPETNARA